MFAKLFSSITESSLWSEPKEVRLLFVTMLAKADQNGFVEASVPGLARVANLSVSETDTALDCLQSPDPYSKNPDNEGRRVLSVPGGFVLLNYEDYRSRRNTEERREYMRDYIREYRKKACKQPVNSSKQKKTSVNRSKPRLAKAETETETDAKTDKRKISNRIEDTPEFEEFWQAYPRKLAKGNARKAWDAAIKKADPDAIIVGAIHYAKNVTDPKFTMHPATWLNAERWLDEEMHARKKPRLPDFDTPEGMAELERLFLENLHT